MRRSHRPGASPRIGTVRDPTWYKDAVIYELRTRSFYDSNDDGIGDFIGLTSKLDYLSDLGITAIWLLPFYPSPGRDDGYDISDYMDVHPDVGTLADFELFLAEAHERGIRVITELVLNHTSDQHPWFQRARRAPKGSPERDFYVWNDTPERYRDARIIFKDFESSNWSWDRVAEAYYWHRFYSHQPDLNFENPDVQEALLGVVDFWLEKGVDGLRLDAVPYLYEEDQTSCENLPKTHVFLRKLRAHVDAKFQDRMLLAEANQWPEDAAAYFGQGDECHMNFHFPLMPRMFMSVHMEDRLPLVDIFDQTPQVHPTCQWALFLRNHDELTLEMVTDEERDYMYRAYAQNQAMRINLGIRRRLAPLVDNARRLVELLNALLLSLPGTPVLYYGDEIGMGDNVYLGDRNGVRTPMQWSMDRNAGFSRANPQRLILPVIIDPEYHYESLNVENQEQNPTSLLWWTKRVLALRKRFKAFGRGTIEFLSPTNPRILAFVRRHEEELVLVVANLSRFTQYAELDLSAHKDRTPVELFGKTRFPVIGAAPYLFTLGPHNFYWFALEATGNDVERTSLPRLPAMLECASIESLLLGEERGQLDDGLATFLDSRRWMLRPGRWVRRAELREAYRLGPAGSDLYLLFVAVTYTNNESDLCAVPVAVVGPDGAPSGPASVLAHVELGQGAAGPRLLIDALDEPETARALLQALDAEGSAAPNSKRALLVRGALGLTDSDLAQDPRKLGHERYDTLVSYGGRFILRFFRHVEEGRSPELEIVRYLSEQKSPLIPSLLGSVELGERGTGPRTVALVEAHVTSVGTAWEATLQELGRYYERVLTRGPLGPPPASPTESALALADREVPEAVGQMIGSFRDTLGLLGRRVAELHLSLAANVLDPSFAPEPYSTLDRRSKYQSLRTLASVVLRKLRERLAGLSARARAPADRLIHREGDVLRFLAPLLKTDVLGLRIRVHNNLHLGHVLYTGKDFVFTDFDGVRAQALSERRRKRSPMRDVAGLVRSVHFAALKHLFDPARVREADVERVLPWGIHWATYASAALVHAYLETAGSAPFLPAHRPDVGLLFDVFVLERELYTLSEQLDQGPDAALASLLGVEQILATRPPG